MKKKKVLLFKKQSAYKFYFVDNNISGNQKINTIIKKDRERFELAHQMHYSTIEHIKFLLNEYDVDYVSSVRGNDLDIEKFDIVISIGGDGTFLEAARHLKKAILIGVNSAPIFSVGRFCGVDRRNFEDVLKKMLKNELKIHHIQRLEFDVNGKKSGVLALNDILVSHSNPAYLCRYHLQIGQKEEEQRSSGVWIATAAGSSAGISSAGGKRMNMSQKKFQYLVREPYYGLNKKYRLQHAVLRRPSRIRMTSLMRRGKIYVDGPHCRIPFEYGTTLDVRLSKYPLKVYVK